MPFKRRTAPSCDGRETTPPGQDEAQAQAQIQCPIQSYIQQSPVDDHHGFLVFPHAELMDHQLIHAPIGMIDQHFPGGFYQRSHYDTNTLSTIHSNNTVSNVSNNSNRRREKDREAERLLGVGTQFQQCNMLTPTQVNEDFLKQSLQENMALPIVNDDTIRKRLQMGMEEDCDVVDSKFQC